jgi:hypothetical protein
MEDNGENDDGSEPDGEIKQNIKDNIQEKESEKEGTTPTSDEPTDDDDDNDTTDGFSSGKNAKGSKIDYGSTMTDAYANLNNLLDPEAIKSLTSDTRELMTQQKDLFKSMESMTRLIGQAKEMLDGFDIKGLSGIGDLMKPKTKKE